MSSVEIASRPVGGKDVTDDKKKRRRAALNEVIPGKLYQRGRFEGWPQKQKERVLKEHNIGMVVNLWAKMDPEVANDTRILYLFYPIYGNKPPPPGMLKILVQLIREQIRYGLAVLIHCEAGVNRSCFLSACVVAELEGMCGEAALGYIGGVCGKVKIHKNLQDTVRYFYP